jgi:acyl-coenzyme A thioesterase PaaI-like protein
VSFDADTALEPVGPGRWRAELHARWSVARGPNGGYVGALVARAAEQATGRPLRSLTTQFLEAPDPGPVDVLATVEREGRSTSSVSVRIERDGRPTALALATLGAWREGEAEWLDARMPQAPSPDEAFRLDPERNGIPAFVGNYDMRWAVGKPPRRRRGEDEGRSGGADRGPGDGLTGGWVRTALPRAVDAPRIVAFSDCWFPAAYSRLGAVVPAPTLDLTVYVRSPLPPPGMGAEDFVLGVFRTRWGTGGLWEEDGELWSPGGVLLAQSRQLALVRT